MRLRMHLRQSNARAIVACCLVTSCAITVVGSAIAMAPAMASAATCASRSMYIVAHEDDSLFFQSPDLLHDIQDGVCVTTVYVTAGDDGYGQAYWLAREKAADAGYASMAGVADNWSRSVTSVSGHDIVTDTLDGAPNVVQLFMRLPDGSPSGSGYAVDNYESLIKLWTGAINVVHTVDGSSSYTAPSLVSTLAALMTLFQPTVIHVQDYVHTYASGYDDHADHFASAYFGRAASNRYATPHRLIGYMGYNTQFQPQNVSGSDLIAKEDALAAYALYDPICDDLACTGTPYAAYLTRQYTVASESLPKPNQTPIANAGDNALAWVGSTVQLTGSGSDPDGDLVTYQWTQTAGPPVALSDPTEARPTFVAPEAAATLTFQLVVNDGQSNSAPSSVTVAVSSTDLALIATATASSQDTVDGSTAAKAIDGVVDGYPGDYTKEWATVGGGAGSWLTLTWASPQTITSVVLHDRPNLNDQITSATLTFSNGTQIAVGTLPNDGTGLTVPVPSITTSTLTLTVDSVSSTTQNIGLAEIEVYGSG